MTPEYDLYVKFYERREPPLTYILNCFIVFDGSYNIPSTKKARYIMSNIPLKSYHQSHWMLIPEKLFDDLKRQNTSETIERILSEFELAGPIFSNFIEACEYCKKLERAKGQEYSIVQLF